ncbi:hypothetical protein DXG03_003779 [Asterophora parasitica]|uniref:Uncharacterized protein n=1 Tax=Asterophora parasitica TaxID=117018 RepID=A0A9P7G2H8_9AGAR|nr:hypothetical protein DXG03_003779 [Asterophora parasitica]
MKAFDGNEAILSGDFGAHGAESVRSIAAATLAIEQAIFKVCADIGITTDAICWPALSDPLAGPSSPREILDIVTWMQEHFGLRIIALDAHAREFDSAGPSLSKIQHPVHKVFDYTQNKWVRMTPTMFKEARDDPEAWPGCVEVGLPIMRSLFRNHTGQEKCLSHKDGPRGAKLPPQNHPGQEQLAGCGCPVRTAALELWLSKTTHTGVSRGGAEEGMPPMKLNHLRAIEGGLFSLCGLTVEALLQPQRGRLEYTAAWALCELRALYAAEDVHAGAIDNLIKTFRDVMVVIKASDEAK